MYDIRNVSDIRAHGIHGAPVFVSSCDTVGTVVCHNVPAPVMKCLVDGGNTKYSKYQVDLGCNLGFDQTQYGPSSWSSSKCMISYHNTLIHLGSSVLSNPKLNSIAWSGLLRTWRCGRGGCSSPPAVAKSKLRQEIGRHCFCECQISTLRCKTTQKLEVSPSLNNNPEHT